MGVQLAQVLGAKNIIGVIEKVKPGLREKTLPPELLTPSRKVSGNYGTYHRTIGERRAARVTNYGAPAQTYEATGVEEVAVNFIHAFQDFAINPSALMNLLDEGNENRQRIGMETIGRQTGDFARTFRNLRVAAITMMLANGKIMWDAQGRLTLNSGTTGASPAARTVNYQIPSTNQGQLPVPRYNANGQVVNNPIISATWSNVATDMLTQLNTIKQIAVLQTGYPLVHAFCGINVKSYIFNNTGYKDYMKRNTGAQDALIKNKIVDGFADFQWHEMYESFYSQDLPNPGAALTANQAIPIFGPDSVVFTPDFDEPWYELIEGSFPIPTDAILAKDAMELMDSLEEAYGHFGFAKMGVDKQPSSIVEFQGDTFLPAILVPYAIYQATVKF
jgi:hypothetical protein